MRYREYPPHRKEPLPLPLGISPWSTFGLRTSGALGEACAALSPVSQRKCPPQPLPLCGPKFLHPFGTSSQASCWGSSKISICYGSHGEFGDTCWLARWDRGIRGAHLLQPWAGHGIFLSPSFWIPQIKMMRTFISDPPTASRW